MTQASFTKEGSWAEGQWQELPRHRRWERHSRPGAQGVQGACPLSAELSRGG